MKQKLLAVGFAAILTTCCVSCAPSKVVPTAQIYYPENAMQEYVQRSDTVTLSAGNDQEVNSRIQMLDPWPPYVADRRIPTSGERMAGAVRRAQDVSKIGTAPKPLSLEGTGSSGGGSSGAK